MQKFKDRLQKDEILIFFCQASLFFFILSLYIAPKFKVLLALPFALIFLIYTMKKGFYLTVYFVWGLILFCIALASNLWTLTPLDTLYGTRAILKIVIIGLFIINFIDTKERLNFLFKCFYYAGLALIIKVLYIVPVATWGSMRISAEGINPNTIGLYLSISTLSAMALYSKGKYSYLYILSGMLFYFVILFTGSRKALLFVTMGMLLFLFLNLKKIYHKIIVSIGFGTILFFIYMLIMKVPMIYDIMGVRIEGLIAAFTGKGNVDPSTRLRFKLMERAVELFKERPFLGSGIASYTELSGYDVYSHNNFLEIVVGIGLVGLIIYYSIYFYSILGLAKLGNDKYRNFYLTYLILLIIMEYGLVTYFVEIYQMMIASSIALLNIKHPKKKVFFKDMYKNFHKLLKNPFKVFGYLANKVPLRFIPDKLYLKLLYRSFTGRKLNLKNPQTFNEKIQWLKLYDRNPIYTKLVDKYAVRDYVSKTIGDQYLIPLIGVYNTPNEINFYHLPNQFVLKSNHGSGDVFICNDRSLLNKKKLRKNINTWLKKNYYWPYREWPYRDIEPKLICEKYLIDDNDSIYLTDYKFYCFNGIPKYCQVISNRGVNETIDFYDENWIKMPFTGLRNLPKSNQRMPKPEKYEEMLRIAQKLSKNIPFVRVDLYYVKNKIYFGEMTFYPQSGFGNFTPTEWNVKVGDLIKLPTQ